MFSSLPRERTSPEARLHHSGTVLVLWLHASRSLNSIDNVCVITLRVLCLFFRLSISELPNLIHSPAPVCLYHGGGVQNSVLRPHHHRFSQCPAFKRLPPSCPCSEGGLSSYPMPGCLWKGRSLLLVWARLQFHQIVNVLPKVSEPPSRGVASHPH